MATGIAIRCCRDARCRQCTGKRLSHTIWACLTRTGCRIGVTVRLPVRLRGETLYWQANANTSLSVTPLLNVPDFKGGTKMRDIFRNFPLLGVFHPTFHAKSPKPIFGDFNGFPPYSRRLFIHVDRFSIIFNQFQSVSISFNQV